jgi:predicted  nucleic acid-binding Zn-ribbon protein
LKCSKCGEEWAAPPGKSHSFCPKCGNNVEAEKKTPQSFDNARDALAHIAGEFGHGNQFLRNSRSKDWEDILSVQQTVKHDFR